MGLVLALTAIGIVVTLLGKERRSFVLRLEWIECRGNEDRLGMRALSYLRRLFS
jgi:hypothetical protein